MTTIIHSNDFIEDTTQSRKPQSVPVASLHIRTSSRSTSCVLINGHEYDAREILEAISSHVS